LLVLSAASAWAPAPAGEIYKSLDADGKVIYSDHLDSTMSQSTEVQLEDPVSYADAASGLAVDAGNATLSSTAQPPPLPEEQQPPLPQDGLIWTPGYWYWQGPRYIWMAGGWVSPPQIGFLWTPPYWRFVGTVFLFYPGHWGLTVGFYGGVNYGYGYFGNGYSGGHWIGNSFAYNSTVNNVSPMVAHHVYAQAVPRGVAQRSASVALAPLHQAAPLPHQAHVAYRATAQPVITTAAAGARTNPAPPRAVSVKSADFAPVAAVRPGHVSAPHRAPPIK
jgi:hypothetical protein